MSNRFSTISLSRGITLWSFTVKTPRYSFSMAIVTDFTPTCKSWGGPGIGVYGTLFASLALGFTEGCLVIERRPIPVWFALRFAVANVLPSTVWSSISARHVAAASGVPLSVLVSDAEVAGPRSLLIAKRLVLVKSVRALRMAVGSYGLAWSVWCWYKSDTLDRDNDKEEVVKYTESVVRLAPAYSPLSRVSRCKHAEHIVIVPMTTENWVKQEVNDAVDWEKVGVNVKLNSKQDQDERVKVIEVELSDVETTVAYARKLRAQGSKGGNSLLYTVAVLPPYGQPLVPSMMDTFDVCFNPLSAVLTFIASICHERGETHVILVPDDVVDQNANASPSSLLATGLLYRHGITTSVVRTRNTKPADEHVKDKATVDHGVDTNSGVVFFIAENLGAGQTIAKKLTRQGIIMQEKACYIVEESLCNQRALSEEGQARSALLEKAISIEVEENPKVGPNDKQEPAMYFSIADVSDQTLQGIRELLRQGEKPDTIQAALYQAYGTQRVVAPTRLDLFSDLDL